MSDLENEYARGRNRKSGTIKGGPSHETRAPVDEEGVELPVDNDEVVLDIDVMGESKVNKLGYLSGGREYRCRTFTVLGRGSRLYMLSTEPARALGFRDSYLFFLRNKSLYKIICDDEEKNDLIDRDIIPASYKGRPIGIVTARSVFRTFGGKMIVGGRRITDDYWEANFRAEGVREGEIADPDDKLPPPGIAYNRNQYVAWHGASQIYHQSSMQLPRVEKKKKVIVTDRNWMLEHALATNSYNSLVCSMRRARWASGFYEPHTNLIFLPENSQPTTAKWTQVDDEEPNAVKLENDAETGFIIDSNLRGADFSISGNGLKDVDPAIYAHLPDDIQESILQQKQKELDWTAQWGTETESGMRAALRV